MATTLLRSLARSTRTATTSRLLARNISTSTVRQADAPEELRQKTGFDYHTVEDLHGMTAHEILQGPTDDSKMRHFTGG